MVDKILVLANEPKSYGKAVEGLGILTSDHRLFFKTPTDFVLVLFTGGSDVDPSFYNDTSPFKMCCSDLARDRFEKTVFRHALNNNIPMIGICRGFQFLNVMAGGRILHHINNHAGSLHPFNSPSLTTSITVNSFHHQMAVPPTDAHIIGQTLNQLSDLHYGKHDQYEKWMDPEIEAAIFPNINACGVQYHPEWMTATSEGSLFFYKLADNLINLPKDEFIKFYTKGNKSGKHKSNAVCTRSNSVTG